MRYRFLYVGADLRKLSLQPRIQQTWREHGYGLVYHAICLFTLPAFARYSFQPNRRGRAQAVRVDLGAWFCAEVVYLPKDGHPPRH